MAPVGGSSRRDGDGRFVVAIDFGTTYSGFAYLQKSDKDKRVLKFYDWKDRPGREYCKTITALYYESEAGGQRFKLVDWGWSALQKSSAKLRFSGTAGGSKMGKSGVTLFKLAEGGDRFGCYVERFKLDLEENKPASQKLSLPGDLTTERLISDYLRSLSEEIMSELRKTFSNNLGKEAIEWCLTVPSIWGERAKQVMRVCAEKSGLIQGTECPTPSQVSPYPLDVILEPEGASMYCHDKRKDELKLRKGNRLLIADVGGGTIDLVVHIKVEDDASGSAVEEVVPSYGEAGGGTFVDRAFFDFLAQKISCLEECLQREPAAQLSIDKEWQRIKTTFHGGSSFSATFSLPQAVRKAWRKHERERRKWAISRRQRDEGNNDVDEDEDEDDYSEVVLEAEDFRRIFDPEVEKVLRLIKEQVAGVKVLMLVGGFASSVYLGERVKAEFSNKVEQIVIPPEPGSAICHGAVLLHLQPQSIKARIRGKTFGLAMARKVQSDDPKEYIFEDDDGQKLCDNVFDVFVRSGERVEFNQSVTRMYAPSLHGLTSMTLRLYSAVGNQVPTYVLEQGCSFEGSFTIDIESGLHLGKSRTVEVTMVFGTSILTISAVGKNFGDGSERVERSFPTTFI